MSGIRRMGGWGFRVDLSLKGDHGTVDGFWNNEKIERHEREKPMMGGG
jgi:hypothetical protein